MSGQQHKVFSTTELTGAAAERSDTTQGAFVKAFDTFEAAQQYAADLNREAKPGQRYVVRSRFEG